MSGRRATKRATHGAADGSNCTVALCGADRDGYNITTARICVDCPRCVKLFAAKVKPLGKCHGCGAPLWDGDHNPCDTCNPGALQRHHTRDETTEYDRTALVMTAAAMVGWDHVPQPGYGPCTTTTYDTRLGPNLGHLVEGGWVVDKRAAQERADFVRNVVGGPMVDTRLSGADVDKCPAIDPFFGAALAGSFGALALLKMADEDFGGLDHVSPEAYAAFWATRGARIGRRSGNVVRWADGGPDSAIPAYADRYKPHDADAVFAGK